MGLQAPTEQGQARMRLLSHQVRYYQGRAYSTAVYAADISRGGRMPQPGVVRITHAHHAGDYPWGTHKRWQSIRTYQDARRARIERYRARMRRPSAHLPMQVESTARVAWRDSAARRYRDAR